MEHWLRTLVNLYVKEFTDFMWKMNSMEKSLGNSVFVTINARFLYKNISNQEIIETMETTLRRKTTGT